jgi:hypothetical protein
MDDRKESMTEEIERNLGEQPIARIMAEAGLKPNDLVSASTVQSKVLAALNAATGKAYSRSDLFAY